MRSLYRNTQPVWYANYKGMDQLTDEYGLYTGEMGVQYDNPVKIRANVSPAQNIAHYALFGLDVSYDKTLTLSNPNLDITENAVIWIEHEPELNEDGSTDTPYEYVVKKISKWKNSLVLAIRGVEVS